jgi:hypothetical protein
MEYLVPGLVILALFWIWNRLDNSTRARCHFVNPSEFGDQDFRPAMWVLILMIFCCIFFAAMAACFLVLAPQAFEIGAAILVLDPLLTILGLLMYAKTRLIIRGDQVTYRGVCFDIAFHVPKIQRVHGLMMEMTFHLSDIAFAYAALGNIVIQFKDRSRKVIPNIFANSGMMLAVLLMHRPIRQTPL